MAGEMLKRYGSELEKSFDTYIRPELGSSKGGRLRKYADWEVIKGESRVIKTGGQGNYTGKVPYLLGETALDGFNGKMTGKTRAQELVPHYRYGYEVMTAEQKHALGGKFQGNEEIFRKLREALELAEDIEIVMAMESVDTLVPATNKIGDNTLPIYAPKNIEMFKTLMVLAASRYTGQDSKKQVSAFMLIDTVDWSKLLVHNEDGGVFMSSDYKHMTGVDGRMVTSVFGVAIEQCNPFEHAMGDANRTELVASGTARLCTYQNIVGASWEATLRTEALDLLANGDTFVASVAKSMSAKVLDPRGCWIFNCKAEALNVYTPSGVGTDSNPMITKAKA